MSIALKSVAFLLAILLSTSAVRADNLDAVGVVNTLHETLVSVMKNADALGVAGRYETLSPVLREAFDFEKMIRFASGSSWKTATPEQRENLVSAFTRLSVSNYAARFSGFSGEVFETLGRRDGPRGSVLVDTRIVRNPDPAVAITYVLTKTDDQWGIVDLLLENKVSEMAVRRSEYNPILRDGGPDKLAAALNMQADELLAE